MVKILTGVQSAVSGSIAIDGHDPLEEREYFDHIAYVPQELSLFSNMTVAENLFIPFAKSGYSNTFVDHRRPAVAESVRDLGLGPPVGADRPRRLARPLPHRHPR